MRCVVCNKGCEEVVLYDGIFKDGMVLVCSVCADREGIPVIRKPSEKQLSKAEEHFSVRERMERMSGMHRSEISPEQFVTQNNLARLRVPPRKQQRDELVDNYHWELGIARRRKKMTTNQLAREIGVEPRVIQRIERGIIPEEFEGIFLKLESTLGIQLLKKHDAKVNFSRSSTEEEEEIIEEVRRKMDLPEVEKDEFVRARKIEAKKAEIKDRVSRGEVDFSKRRDLDNITLNDLVEMKKERESRVTQKKERIRIESLVGDDLEIDMEDIV